MSVTHDEVLTQIRGILSKHAKGGLHLQASTELVADLGIDSLARMEALAEIEDRFELTLEESQLQALVTLGDLVEAIQTQLGHRGES